MFPLARCSSRARATSRLATPSTGQSSPTRRSSAQRRGSPIRALRTASCTSPPRAWTIRRQSALHSPRTAWRATSSPASAERRAPRVQSGRGARRGRGRGGGDLAPPSASAHKAPAPAAHGGAGGTSRAVGRHASPTCATSGLQTAPTAPVRLMFRQADCTSLSTTRRASRPSPRLLRAHLGPRLLRPWQVSPFGLRSATCRLTRPVQAALDHRRQPARNCRRIRRRCACGAHVTHDVLYSPHLLVARDARRPAPAGRGRKQLLPRGDVVPKCGGGVCPEHRIVNTIVVAKARMIAFAKS